MSNSSLQASEGAGESEDDYMMDDTDSTDFEDDIEEQIKHIKEYNNEKQLRLLRKEIDHIIIHNLEQSEGWYDDRFVYIYEYSGLGWRSLRQMFKDRDEYIYTTVSSIIDTLTDVIESRYTKPTFNIKLYQKVIHDIDDVWNYYSQVYSKEDDDLDILELIDGMKNLAK